MKNKHNYYYFSPFNKQYFFPSKFKSYEVFKSFYKVYTLGGGILWYIWYKVPLVRSFFQIKDLSKYIPDFILNRYFADDTILAFNRGSKGLEQKLTIIGLNKSSGQDFFIKYGESEIACKNINNEAEILTKIRSLDFVPQLLNVSIGSGYALIETSIIKGDRYNNTVFNRELKDILFRISEIKIGKYEDNYFNVKQIFAHGDFCPWNLMIYREKIYVFDWELAGLYPVGYDLFTYIFQTSFLLTPSISVKKLIEENSIHIDDYFKNMDIDNWKPYLVSFANIKFKSESLKNDKHLIYHYKLLKEHAEKI